MKTNKRNELRRLVVILKDSNDAITVQDLTGNILSWNKGAVKMYGYSEAEALSMNIKSLIPPETNNVELKYLEQIASGSIVDSYETKRVTKDGKIIDVWLVITCLKDNKGSISSIATTERDVTERNTLLRKKESEVKVLRGMLPICASCKEIRDDDGYWHQIESYIRKHSEADFSHSLCPKCAKKLYPNIDLDSNGNQKN